MFGSFLCGIASADQSVSLTWDRNTDTNVMGYYLYLGTTNGSYTSKIDVGTNTTATIVNMAGRSTTYYFAATAYNSNRLESPPSNQAQFLTSSNAGPALTAVPDKNAMVNAMLIVTNAATDTDMPVRHLTYSLDSGAPTGMMIDPLSGRIYWTPRIDVGGTTNPVTVRVNDGTTQSLYSAKSFNVVVSNAAQVSLGTTVMALGQTNTVPLVVVATAPVTNVSFVLDLPAGRVSNVSVQGLMPAVVTVTQTPVGAAHSTISIKALSGQYLVGTNAVAQVTFTAATGKPSTFAALSASSPNATLSTGQAMPGNFGVNGEAVIVGAESLLRPILRTNGQRDMVIYGPSNNKFVVESCNSPTATSGWVSEVTSSTMGTNLTQTFPNFTTNTNVRFYRARSL